MNKLKWIFVGGIAVVLVTLVSVLVVRHKLQNDPKTARRLGQAIPVQVAAVKRSEMQKIIGANAIVQPLEMITLTPLARFVVLGKVETILVDIGDIVKKDQSLLQFNPLSAELAVTSAKADLLLSRQAVSSARVELELFQKLYADGMGTAVTAHAENSLKQARMELEWAERDLRRTKSSYRQGLVSGLKLEEAELRASETRIAMDKMRTVNYNAQLNLLRQLEDAKLSLAKAEAVQEDRNSRLQRAKQDLLQMTVRSPVAGVVIDRNISPGEMPKANGTLMTIGRIDQVMVRANLSEAYLSKVYPGQDAEVTMVAFPDEVFRGKLVLVKPVTNPKNKTFPIFVKLDNPGLRIRPGLSGFIRLNITQKALAVPSVSILKSESSHAALFKLDQQQRARLNPVKLGQTAEQLTEIQDGLSEGDLVVVSGQYHLRDGDPVRLRD